MLQHTQLSFLG